MKIYAINGSPRNNYNTTPLLEEYLKGIASISTKIEMEKVHLYAYQYTGCRECMHVS